MYNLFVFVCFGVLTYCAAENYCNVPSCTKNSHTMCMYPTNATSKACGQVVSANITDGEKNLIIYMHNYLRAIVAYGKETRGNPGPQPAAKNMVALLWDEELATIAQRWANQCKSTSDKCRNTDTQKVGQNMGCVNSTELQYINIYYVPQIWYNEVIYFNKNTVSNYRFDPKTKDYTQMVWAKTTHFGCGRMRTVVDGIEKDCLVCNYKPAGNEEDEPVYEIVK